MIQVLNGNGWSSHPSMLGAVGSACPDLSDAALARLFAARGLNPRASSFAWAKTPAAFRAKVTALAALSPGALAAKAAAAPAGAWTKLLYELATATRACVGGLAEDSIFSRYKWPLIGAGALLLGFAAWKFMK